VLEQLVIVRRPEENLARTDLCLKYMVLWTGPASTRVYRGFQGNIQGFSFGTRFSHKLGRGKSDSISELYQELLTEFPIDKKRATFEYLSRVMYSAQSMSVMFLMEMTNFQESDNNMSDVQGILGQHGKMFDHTDDDNIPMDDIHKKISRFCETDP
jgi:hypothetical protein